MSKLAGRMAHIRAFEVMRLLEEAKRMEAQGQSIIHMEIGEPDFESPPQIVEAGIEALKLGRTHYVPALGLPELRQAISDFYCSQYQVQVDPARIIITPGASGALLLAFSLFVEPGSEVFLSDPGYPCNRNFVSLLGGKPVSLPVDAQSAYQLSCAMLAQHWNTRSRVALLSSPSNPTGTLVPVNELKAMMAFIAERQGTLIVDEIYQGLLYGTQPETALKYSDDVFIINSFSKYFGMTGWRIGWMVVPEEYVAGVEKLAQNLFISTSTPAQYAALAAFSADVLSELEHRRSVFQTRRDYLVNALKTLGLHVPIVPQGAFYVYANCSAFCSDSYQWCNDMLKQAGVAVTPGIDFGQHLANQHVRFAYTTSMEKLEEGIARLKAV